MRAWARAPQILRAGNGGETDGFPVCSAFAPRPETTGGGATPGMEMRAEVLHDPIDRMEEQRSARRHARGGKPARSR